MPKFTPDSKCEVTTLPLDNGGICATVIIPTYCGGVALTIEAQRQGDRSWVVYMPDTSEYDESNGIVYLGAPDVPVKRKV